MTVFDILSLIHGVNHLELLVCIKCCIKKNTQTNTCPVFTLQLHLSSPPSWATRLKVQTKPIDTFLRSSKPMKTSVVWQINWRQKTSSWRKKTSRWRQKTRRWRQKTSSSGQEMKLTQPLHHSGLGQHQPGWHYQIQPHLGWIRLNHTSSREKVS